MKSKDFQQERHVIKLIKEIDWYLKVLKEDIKVVLEYSIFDTKSMYLEDDIDDVEMLKSMITAASEMQIDLRHVLDKFNRFHGKVNSEDDFYTVYDSLEDGLCR